MVEVFVGRVRSVVLHLLFTVVTLGIYFFVWFAKLNRELERSVKHGASPAGRLVLFLLVPVVGWFVAVLLAGRSVRRVQLKAGSHRLIVPVYHAVWAALVPVLGWWIAMAYLQRGANRAWLKMDASMEPAAQQNTRIQCPDCDNLFVTLWNPLVPHATRCPHCGRVGDV